MARVNLPILRIAPRVKFVWKYRFFREGPFGGADRRKSGIGKGL